MRMVRVTVEEICCLLLQRHVPHLPGWNRLHYSHRTATSKRCSMLSQQRSQGHKTTSRSECEDKAPNLSGTL